MSFCQIDRRGPDQIALPQMSFSASTTLRPRISAASYRFASEAASATTKFIMRTGGSPPRSAKAARRARKRAVFDDALTALTTN
jgi:hypothetical protein